MESINNLYFEMMKEFENLTLNIMATSYDFIAVYNQIKSKDYSEIELSLKDSIERIKQVKNIEPESLIVGLVKVRKYLSNENFDLSQIIEDTNIYDYFILLLDTSKEEIKYEALWCITNLCLKKESIDELVDRGLLAPLKECLFSQYSEIKQQATWVYFNIMGEGQTYVTNVIDYPTLEEILKGLIKSDLEGKVIYLQTFANFCKFKIKKNFHPIMNKLLLYTVKLYIEPGQQNEEIAEEILYIYRYITENTPSLLTIVKEQNLFEPISRDIIMKLETNYPIKRKFAAQTARIMGNLCVNEDPLYTDYAINIGIIKLAALLLERFYQDNYIKKEIFWTMSNICSGTNEQCLAVFENSFILNKLVEIITDPNEAQDVKKEGCFAFSNLVVKKILAVREYALREINVEILFLWKNFISNDHSASVLLEALTELLGANDFPEVSKHILYQKLNEKNYLNELIASQTNLEPNSIVLKKVKTLISMMGKDDNIKKEIDSSEPL